MFINLVFFSLQIGTTFLKTSHLYVTCYYCLILLGQPRLSIFHRAFNLAGMPPINVQAKNVDTVFWRVSRELIWWKKACRFKGNQKMRKIRIGRWSAADGPRRIFREDADSCVWVIGRWRVTDEWRREKKVRILRGFWWFSCNILV